MADSRVIEVDRRWSLGRRVTQLVAAAAALLVLLLVVLSVALNLVKVRGDDVIDRWDPASQDSQAALSDMVNQETGLRGYAVTRRAEFLQPYQAYQDPERAAERDLSRLLHGDRALLSLLTAFEARVDDWHDQVALPFIARVAAGDDTVATDVVGDQARASFDALRSASADLTRAIDRRSAEAQASRRQAFGIVWIVGATGTIVLVGAALLLLAALRRSVLAPISSLVAQTREVASGRLDLTISQHGPREIMDLGADVDAMRARLAAELGRVERSRQRLARTNDELARSNDDLEQFAYVASHDLSEPLRKVTNFCQLLERQYAGELDDKARTYIGFMVDGAKRMQALINDLLAFSRVGRSTDHFVPVDLDEMLRRALANLEGRIEASGAVVQADPLPTVPGDPTLLTALLQNLVGNAVKYHDPERPPRVRLTARLEGDAWELAVSDNGIGIEPQYAERIFAIFQRLHLRDQYDGTGIGLALCRKIVEFHNGELWLADPDAESESEPDAGTGACFRFRLPVRQEPSESDEDNELSPPPVDRDEAGLVAR